MKVFLSYATEDRLVAEEIQLALIGAAHEVFFDRQSLPPGGEYHARIRAAVDWADLFVFLISPDAVAAGGYTLTEMGYARARWPHPKERVLPVIGRPTPFEKIPAYLKSATVLEPQGNTAAEVMAAVARLSGAAAPSVAAPPPTSAAPGGRKTGWLVAVAGVPLLIAAGVFFWPTDGASDPERHQTAGPVEAAKTSTPKVPTPLELRFSYDRDAAAAGSDLDATVRVDLTAGSQIVSKRRLARQDAGYYSQDAPFPAENERIRGAITHELPRSTQGNTPPPVEFCLKRPSPLQIFNDGYVHLDCHASAGCRLHVPTPRWLEPCPEEQRSQEPRKAFFSLDFVPTAHAAGSERRWAVPSVETLAAHENSMRGVGYTLFLIETDALRQPGTIGVEVDVRVNGTPVLEDGLDAALRPVPHDPTRPFRHSFALQSLDFEGAQGGCEAIVITLRPRMAGGARGTPLSLTLPYVALRDAAPVRHPLGDGSLTWSARYVVPADEWSHEAFIASVSYPDSAGPAAARQRVETLKNAFDRLGLRYQGRPVVGVIRPPLTQTGATRAYGLTAGIVQPSGQVRFTFSPAEAGSIGDLLLAARHANPAAKSVISPAKYIYRVAGTPERRETPTPAGTCDHVRAP